MHFSTIFAATALAGAAFAEDHTIAVSNKDGDLTFNPDSVQAAENDNIIFKFWPKNHSVAQSTFASPCEPMDNGMWSGFVPTDDTEEVAETTFHYTVTNASMPVWFYCSQGKHCQGGMVGVINPPQSGQNTLEAFKRAASNADSNVSPSSSEPMGGMLMEGDEMEGGDMEGDDMEDSEGAASSLSSSMAFTGLMAAVAYFMM